MKRSGLCTIFFLVILISCDKSAQITRVTKDQTSSDSTVVTFGDYTDMMVNYYDTVLAGSYHDQRSFDLDINNDQTADIRLISEIGGSPVVGQIPGSTIECLNPDVQLSGYYKSDTSFLNTKTRIVSESNPIEVQIYQTYSCHRIDSIDTVVGVRLHQFKILPGNKGNILQKGLEFKPDTSVLAEGGYTWPPIVINWGTDTITVLYNIYTNDCNSFPSEEIKYIGLKMNVKNVWKLGWIKLSISDKYRISILESAIQR